MALINTNIANQSTFTSMNILQRSVRLQATFLNFENPTGNQCSYLISKKGTEVGLKALAND